MQVFFFLLLAMEENRKEAEFKKENCVICLKGFIAEVPPTKVTKVCEKGLLTLIEFSKGRNYTQLEQYLKKLEKKKFLSIKSAAEISLT